MSFFNSPWSFAYTMLTAFEYDRFKTRTFNPTTDMNDLTGKVAIVTGSNHGIGYNTVKHLARRGAKVYLAARNEARALDAMKRLKAEGLGPGNGELEFIELDLSAPAMAQRAAKQFLLREERLDILINNASILLQDPPEYKDGILEYMVVNHLSPFAWTQTLLPLMKKTAMEPGSDVRMVNVSSDAHYYTSPDIRFRNLEDLNIDYAQHPMPFYGCYCASKLANVLYAKELQRRMDAEGVPITTLSLHPGNVNTFARSSPYPRLAAFLMTLIFMPPEVGGYVPSFAAAAPIVKTDARYKGGYLKPVVRLDDASKCACDPELAKELWETSVAILKEKGVDGL